MKMRKAIRYGLQAAGVSVAVLVALWLAFPFPLAKLEQYPASLILTDRDGAPLRVVLGAGDVDCRPGYWPGAADWIGKAVVAAEDRRFLRHPGLDPLAVLRAAWQDLRHWRRVSGASTITTQVIRLLEPRPRTVVTKLIESWRALHLERRLDKTGILAQYLRRAPFGGNLVGIDAASRRYFGKAPGDLSLAEAALLAGLPQAPARLRPDRHLDRARRRQAWVLERMLVCGMITREDADRAQAQEIVLKPEAYPFRAPHFTELAVRQATGRGVQRTTLMPQLQARAEAALRQHRPGLQAAGITGGAVVLLEVKTGAVRVLVGSPDYWDRPHRGQVNGALAPRAAGSVLKPFLYALAVDQGRLTPGRMLADVPMFFRGCSPENFDSEFRGLVTAHEALVQSLNIPALQLAEEVQPQAFYDTLARLGLTTLRRGAEHYGAGLVLGTCDVRLLELANAYACLARGGQWLPWRTVARGAAAEPIPVFSAEAAWLVADMLSGDERALGGTGHRADAWRPRVAWKTGTSCGLRDAWTIAWNPEYVLGVWFGNPDGRGAPALVGVETAAPVALELFYELYRGREAPWFERPPGVVPRQVCAASGMPAGLHCPDVADDAFIPGITCVPVCGVHRLVAVGKGADGANRSEVKERWPAPVAAFLRRQQGDRGGLRLGDAVGDAAVASGSRLRIVAPAGGGTFRCLPPGLDREPQRLQLRAQAGSSRRLYWFVDNQPLGSALASESLYWPLQSGRHTVVCADADGHADRVTVLVE